jgi:hypothetical protein
MVQHHSDRVDQLNVIIDLKNENITHRVGKIDEKVEQR